MSKCIRPITNTHVDTNLKRHFRKIQKHHMISVSPEIPTKNIDYIRNRRSTGSRPYLERNQKSNSRGKTTTAHPILVQGSFLDVQPIQDIRTTRTRRTNQPKGPAKILTNLNVRVETTTILQRGSASSNKVVLCQLINQ